MHMELAIIGAHVSISDICVHIRTALIEPVPIDRGTQKWQMALYKSKYGDNCQHDCNQFLSNYICEIFNIWMMDISLTKTMTKTRDI